MSLFETGEADCQSACFNIIVLDRRPDSDLDDVTLDVIVEHDDGIRKRAIACFNDPTYATLAYSLLRALEDTPDAVDGLGTVVPRIAVYGMMRPGTRPGERHLLTVLRLDQVDVCTERDGYVGYVATHPIRRIPDTDAA